MTWTKKVHQFLDLRHTAPYDKKAHTCTNPECGATTFQWQWFSPDHTRMWRYCTDCHGKLAVPAMRRAGVAS